MVNWYWNMTHGQRVLCWVISLLLIWPFLIGLIFVILLLYCALGEPTKKKEVQESDNQNK